MGEVMTIWALMVFWGLTAIAALEMRSRWKQWEAEAKSVCELCAQRGRELQALETECRNMAQTISQLNNTLAQVGDRAAEDPKPIKVRNSAEARRLVEQMNLSRGAIVEEAVESKGEANV